MAQEVLKGGTEYKASAYCLDLLKQKLKASKVHPLHEGIGCIGWVKENFSSKQGLF